MVTSSIRSIASRARMPLRSAVRSVRRVDPAHGTGSRIESGESVQRILFVNQYYWPDHASTAQHLTDLAECPLPSSYPGGECDVLLRADDIVHDDSAPVQAQIVRKAFRGSEFLYTLRLADGLMVMAHVPSHHDHAVGEWIGIYPQVDHVVTFPRA